ncbi:sodium/solute symporter [Candidatus Poribacteria bacterium]|nr:sodium/solute symporter [Candidatus Poribacteria bacterium]
MDIKYIVVFGYLGLTLLLGIYSYRYSKKSLADYFLAGRGIGPIVLFFTMAATNFSAFTIFGFSGEGYRSGYAYYPLMGFGTGFMALSFFVIGRRAWLMGKKRGYITPPELIGDRFKSENLRLIYLAVMVIFTLPYIALQPRGAGLALESLLGIPYFQGAVIITVFVLIYVFLGGMRGIAWTDVLQGIMMLVFMLIAVRIVASAYGGLFSANYAVRSEYPVLFGRPGMAGKYTIGLTLSYMMLWFFCDPLFPQLFQRFFAAKNEKSLKVTMILYPLITGLLFLLPITIGVLGRLTFPDLEGRAADSILPMLLNEHTAGWLGALILSSALAALMSTADSQFLTLSSMLTRDIYEVVLKRESKNEHIIGRVLVVILAVIGLALAYKPPSTILQIATQTFTGLAVLFPATFAALYWRRATAKGAIWSILVGEFLVVLYYLKSTYANDPEFAMQYTWGADVLKVIPTFGLLPVIPILIVTSLVLIIVSLFTSISKEHVEEYFKDLPTINPEKRKYMYLWIAIFGIMFIASIDFWAWGSNTITFLGYPWWIWYFIGLNLILTIAMVVFSNKYWTDSYKEGE